jgi:hypothetical protein
MDLTSELKAEIDSLSLHELLSRWRFAPVGALIFQGESGTYWGERMTTLRRIDPEGYVAASKALSL